MWMSSTLAVTSRGSVLTVEIFTIRFALGQNGDHFPFWDLQQEEHSFLPHNALKINIIHLKDKNKEQNSCSPNAA